MPTLRTSLSFLVCASVFRRRTRLRWLGVRGGVEGCRHASQVADARRSTSGAPATRACSAPATDGREQTYARHDRASRLGVRSRRAPRGSLEASEAPAGATFQRPQAPAPYDASERRLPNRPNHLRILAAKLRVTCISTSLPPPSAQWPVRSTREERLGRHHDSRSSRTGAAAPCTRVVGRLAPAYSSELFASIIAMISGDRAATIERQLARLLDVGVEELRDYLAGNIGTSSTRRTGFRFVRGTHGGHYVRDREGIDIRPPGVSVR